MYESGYSVNIFKILERDVVDFLNYIPIDYYLGSKRKEIFSPKLAELLIRIGSQIDTFFRNWDVVHEVYNTKNTEPLNDVYDLKFQHFRDIEAEKKLILGDKEIKIIATDEILTPFLFWMDKRYPLWWDAYNKVKHNGFLYNKSGSLSNVIESLSALFLINCIHNKTQLKLVEYGYRKYDSLAVRKYILAGPMDRPDSYNNPYITSQLFEFKR